MNLDNDHLAFRPAEAPLIIRPPEPFFAERPPDVLEVDPLTLRKRTRRDILRFGAIAMVAVASGTSLLPSATLERLGILHKQKNWPGKERLLTWHSTSMTMLRRRCIHEIVSSRPTRSRKSHR